MKSLIFILAIVSNMCYVFKKIKINLHMLQLNSYFNSRYFKWILSKKFDFNNIKEYQPLLAMFIAFFNFQYLAILIFSLIYFNIFFFYPKIISKKPFVFTYRAIRLYITIVIIIFSLYGTIFGLWLFSKKTNFILILMLTFLFLCHFCLPFLILLTNFLITPIEKLVQFFYIRKAKIKLKSISKLKIIGITGSFGKTTTKYVLNQILSYKYNTLMTPSSYNTMMGVTKTILSALKPIHEIFIVEMSAKKRHDIDKLCKLVHPQYGIITIIGEQHLETFKTIEQIKKTKNELIISLPKNGIAFFNMDDTYSRELAAKAHCRIISYGTISNEFDYYVSDISLNSLGSKFKITKKNDGSYAIFNTTLLGKHNISNILAAVTIASEMGMKLLEMVNQIRQLDAIPHRLELRRLNNNITFIDDAFNSNIIGSKIALDVLKNITGKRKIIITPGLIELGKKENFYNMQFGLNIADVCDYVILVGKKKTFDIQQGLIQKLYSKTQIFIAKDFLEAKKHLIQILQNGDVVLFENDLPDNYNE